MKKAKPVDAAVTEIAAAFLEIRSRDWQRRRAGVRALAEIDTPEAEQALLQLLDHRSSDVRLTVLEALVKRETTTARLAARASISDNNVLIRNTAADALAAVGTRLDRCRLEQALHDEDWVVRATAADSLGRVAKKAARPALILAMRQDPNPVVRRDAAFALSYANDPSVLPVMEAALAAEAEEQSQIGLLNGVYALGKHDRAGA